MNAGAITTSTSSGTGPLFNSSTSFLMDSTVPGGGVNFKKIQDVAGLSAV
jgi:hypothetical protein